MDFLILENNILQLCPVQNLNLKNIFLKFLSFS